MIFTIQHNKSHISVIYLCCLSTLPSLKCKEWCLKIMLQDINRAWIKKKTKTKPSSFLFHSSLFLHRQKNKLNNLINPIYWENLHERGRQRKTEEGKSTVTSWNKKEVEAEVIRGQGKMWKRTMWKHILLEYADITCVVENVQPQKKKKKNSGKKFTQP